MGTDAHDNLHNKIIQSMHIIQYLCNQYIVIVEFVVRFDEPKSDQMTFLYTIDLNQSFFLFVLFSCSLKLFYAIVRRLFVDMIRTST
jgi:hypothetical protein